MILIIIVSQGFDSEVSGIEESAIHTATAKTTVGVNLTHKLHSLSLLWHSPDLLELTVQKPQVMHSD
jgi:hypothetical protein